MVLFETKCKPTNNNEKINREWVSDIYFVCMILLVKMAVLFDAPLKNLQSQHYLVLYDH